MTASSNIKSRLRIYKTVGSGRIIQNLKAFDLPYNGNYVVVDIHPKLNCEYRVTSVLIATVLSFFSERIHYCVKIP